MNKKFTKKNMKEFAFYYKCKYVNDLFNILENKQNTINVDLESTFNEWIKSNKNE